MPSGTSRRSGLNLQARLVAAFAGLAAVAVTVFGLLTRYGFDRFVDGLATEIDQMPGGQGGPWSHGFVPFRRVLEAIQTGSGLAAQLNWWTVLAAAAVLGGAVVAGVLIARHIAVPLRRITQAARLMARGRFDLRVPVGSGEVGELAEALNQLAGGLETADQERRRLLADVSHELKTPVTGLRGFMEGVHDGMVELDGPTLKAILDEISRLERMIASLDASVLDGGPALRKERVDLGRIAATVAATMAPRAEAAGRTLAVAPPSTRRSGLSGRNRSARAPDPSHPPLAAGPSQLPAVPELWVIGDPDRLTQALLNLVDNAVKFTDAGGRIDMLLAEVDEVPGQAGGWVEVTVSDTGPGIDPEDLPHVFERFYRGEKSRSRATGGAGIGLAVAREVARAHGGEITVESETGRGSTFRFRLPATPTQI